MIGPVFNHGTYAISGASSPFGRPQTLQARQAADQDLRAVQRNVVGLRQALEGLVESLGSRSSTPQGAPSARSRLLGLQEQRLTFLESSEEINAHSTSYGPRSPRFQGRSSSHVSVRGHYDGSQGDSRLTVEVLLGGRVGGRRDPVLRVLDGEGQELERFAVRRPGRGIELNNGLELTFGPGRMFHGDRFAIRVSVSEGGAVNPNNPFNGEGEESPGFEQGVAVGNGRFQVNGERIRVHRTDSINDIVGRINDSDAGVRASFDATTERVRLTLTDSDARDRIVLGRDTSGFLKAVKLDDANVEHGVRADADRPFAEVAALRGVSSGSFVINGVDLEVDVLRDSLNDVVSRINRSGSRVRAGLGEDGQRLGLASRSGKHGFELDDGSSGLFSALGIRPGKYEVQESEGPSVARVGQALGDVSGSFDGLFGDEPQVAGGVASRSLGTLQTDLKSMIAEALGDDADGRRSRLGIEFDLRDNAKQLLRFNGAQRQRLRSALASRPREVQALLVETAGGKPGLLNQMIDRLRTEETSLHDQRGSLGAFLDTRG